MCCRENTLFCFHKIFAWIIKLITHRNFVKFASILFQKIIKMEVGNLMGNDENLSDDEIFFGKMTLKEAKKLIFINYPQHQTMCCSTSNENDEDESIKIIETNSEPDLVLVSSANACNKVEFDIQESCKIIRRSDTEIKTDDSFIKLEKMVSELCMSPTDKHPQLDSTLEVVDFILNNAEQNKLDSDHRVLPCLDDIHLDVDIKTVNLYEDINTPTNTDNDNNTQPHVPKENKMEKCKTETCNTPKAKSEDYCDIVVSDTASAEYTSKIVPVQKMGNVKCDILSVTPKNKNNINSNHVFKTPKNPVSSKKQISSTKKTPNRLNAYQHITSPIASYIKNCPQVPLVKDVHPQRPLLTKSSIPQPIRYVSKAMNKENIQFPAVAYKSAKKTQMVSVPNQDKMPKGEWTNKLSSTLKKPVVITHGQRVMNNAVKNLNKRQEDSFANLTLQQADLSVCTKKSAF